MYAAGYYFKVKLAEKLGLPSDIGTMQVQETMAEGYGIVALELLAIFMLINSISLLYSALKSIERLIDKHLKGKFSKYSNFKLRYLRLKQSVKRVPSYQIAILVFSILLISSIISGSAMSHLKFENVDSYIQNGCQADCFAYETESKTIIGMAVFAGPDLMVIHSKNGTQIVETNSVHRIYRWPPNKH